MLLNSESCGPPEALGVRATQPGWILALVPLMCVCTAPEPPRTQREEQALASEHLQSSQGGTRRCPAPGPVAGRTQAANGAPDVQEAPRRLSPTVTLAPHSI